MLAAVELPEDRQRAADTLVEEAEARLRDPAFGCVSYITLLQEYNKNARAQVDAMREQIAREFGPEAAAEPVDVAAADPSVKLQARAQVDAALKDAREKDRMLLGARQAADARRWQAHQGAVDVDAGKGLDAPRRRGRPPKSRGEHRDQHMAGPSSSQQAMPMPQAAQHAVTAPGFPGERSHQQMARRQKPIAEREPAMSMPQQMYGQGQMHQPTEAAAETLSAEATTSRQAPAVPSFLDGYQRQQMAAETGQWDAAAEQDVMSMMQQSAADAWQNQDPAAQSAMTPQQMEVEEQQLAAETAGRQRSFWSSYYASLGGELAPWLEQLLELQHTSAEVQSEQEQDAVMTMLMQQAPAAGVAPDQDLMMPLLAADVPRFVNLAAQHEGTELDGVVGYGHANVRQQITGARQVAATGEVAREQHMAMGHAAASELAEQEEMVQMAAGAQQRRQHAMAQYAQAELDFTLGHGPSQSQQEMVQEQQLAAAAEAAREKDNIMRQLIAAGVLAREQEQFTQQAAAAEVAREQEMTMIQRAAAAQQQHSRTELDVVPGQMSKQQQLANAAGLAGEPSLTVTQEVATYVNAGQGSSSGAAMAFQSTGSSGTAPFLVNQQLPPQGQTATALGLQMSSSLPPRPPSLSQPYAQVSHQQRAVGGDQGQSSDLAGYHL
ncbi:hypothetical protein BS78_02G039600 [Paspalum vaginatum]|nr:hypothetical protein BS78_02G039600 [Paspalum vaginatum]